METIRKEACLSFFYLGPSFYLMQSRGGGNKKINKSYLFFFLLKMTTKD